jgi:hypothetical protein
VTFEPLLATSNVTVPAGALSVDSSHDASPAVTEILPAPPAELSVVAFWVHAASTGSVIRATTGKARRMVVSLG